MIEGIPSKTAIGPAVRRATESARPESKRICRDEYAQYFITPHSTAIGESRLPRWLVNLYLDCWSEIGVGNLVVVRTRYFDDAVLRAKAEGIKQLVILGAGYDSRCYRLIRPDDGIAAFEVDFPATQAHKRSVLERAGRTVSACSLRSHRFSFRDARRGGPKIRLSRGPQDVLPLGGGHVLSDGGIGPNDARVYSRSFGAGKPRRFRLSPFHATRKIVYASNLA